MQTFTHTIFLSGSAKTQLRWDGRFCLEYRGWSFLVSMEKKLVKIGQQKLKILQM